MLWQAEQSRLHNKVELAEENVSGQKNIFLNISVNNFFSAKSLVFLHHKTSFDRTSFEVYLYFQTC